MVRIELMLLQEHCYFEQDIKLLENVLGDVQVYGVSRMYDNEFRSVRPFSGCDILLRNSLKCNFTIFYINNRCCGGVMKINNVSILLFNGYMPCDTSCDCDNCDIFQNIVNDICYKYEHIDYVIIGGDLNTDLRRVTSLHTQTLNVLYNMKN